VKLPRDISGAETVKALRRLGFEIVRQEGSHIRMSKHNIRVTVPNHRQLVPKTLQSILHQAEVTLEEFMEQL
jgi:predicted RNA binding protein YcfA (HicA-like mRNA interferase family)